MKKIISMILAAAFVLTLCIPVLADSPCDHRYTAEHHEKNCQSAGYTVYTCALCSDTYTKYDYEYDDPGVFAIVFSTVRDDDNMTLTLTAEIINNPGLTIGIMEVGYNRDTLTATSIYNGDIWPDNEISFGAGGASRYPLKVYSEHMTDDLLYDNGTYFEAEFSILDPDGDYGFQYIILRNNFGNFDAQFFTPPAIDLAGKAELGCHLFEDTVIAPTCTEKGYTVRTCSVCGYSESTDETEPLGHTPGEATVIVPPTLTEEGVTLSLCTVCGGEVYGTVPVLERWERGDINNDKKVNVADCNLLKKLIIGQMSSENIQLFDAADLNGDDKINVTDMNILKKMLVGAAS